MRGGSHQRERCFAIGREGRTLKLGIFRSVRQAARGFVAHDMPTYAAALAYRLLFSLFPFLVFLTTLLGFLGVPQLFDWMREQAAYVLPGEAMALVDTIVTELQTPQGGFMSVAVALALWSASAAVLGTMDALNVVFAVKERRPGWKRVAVSLLYTLALALMLVLAAFMMITGPQLLTWLTHYVRLDAYFIALWTWIRWPIVFVLLILVVSAVYYAAPNVRQPFRLVTPGAVLAVTIWVAASIGFGSYVQNFASYNTTYGSLGAVIVLLFYFFLSAAVMLFGAEVNAVLARSRGEQPEEAQ
ncbi:MAG: YihY/virulence factor BrkB family protein [Burkholderiales bacterium]|nr:YihY/virulence factor BrkB family protein [Burkholderiales bacterium]